MIPNSLTNTRVTWATELEDKSHHMYLAGKTEVEVTTKEEGLVGVLRAG